MLANMPQNLKGESGSRASKELRRPEGVEVLVDTYSYTINRDNSTNLLDN